MEVGGGGGGGGRKRKSEKPLYKGIRMRKWGKWVAEIREPNKRSRLWLGSYSTAKAAARAYDTAVYYLRGPSARFNFPESVVADQLGGGGGCCDELSTDAIRLKAVEVGSRVDALEATSVNAQIQDVEQHPNNLDLNKLPKPEPDAPTHNDDDQR